MITLKVTPDGKEPYVVTCTSRDVLTWEKTTKGNKSFANLMAEPNLIDFYKLAHLASWRQGLFVGNYAEFEAQCEVTGRDQVEDEEEDPDEEPDPTQSAASAEPSSPSPAAPASARPRGRKKANAQ